MIVMPSYTGTFFDDTSPEIVDKILLNLDLEDLLTAELVCTVWHQISSANKEIWIRIANQRLLDCNGTTSIRVQVLSSFIPFCQAARIIFPEITKSIPDDIGPARQRLLINKITSELDKSKIDPTTYLVKLLEKYLQVDLSFNDLIQYRMNQNIKYMPSFQVWIESGIKFSDEFYDRAWMKHYGYINQIQVLFMKHVEDKSLYTAHAANDESLTFLNTIEKLDRVHKSAFKFMEYLAHHINNSSYQSVYFLCSMYARKQWLKDFESINIKRYERNQDLNIKLKIDYPDYIHLLIKKLDEEQFTALTENLNIADGLPAQDAFEIYANNAMNESFKESILSTRTPKIKLKL